MNASAGSGWREHVLFLGRFLRHPRTIGAIAPSSASLAHAMVRDLDLDGDKRVVELGPGTGALTGAILARLGPTARCLAIDREQQFVERLRQRWPHLECVCESAVELPALASARGLMPVDHIVSGLPFASLPVDVTAAILDSIERTLRPGGTFTTFQYVHAYRMAAAVEFRRNLSHRLGGAPHRELVMRNVPPAYVLTWRKGT
jgi:phosphatidylethanolamine/phosphatidyl-N-methylethanolamine N-methyltransferase